MEATNSNNTSNEPRIEAQIKTTLANVFAEFQDVSGISESDFKKVLNTCTDILKLVNNFPEVKFDGSGLWNFVLASTELPALQGNVQLLKVLSLLVFQFLCNKSTSMMIIESLREEIVLEKISRFMTSITINQNSYDPYVTLDFNHLNNHIDQALTGDSRLVNGSYNFMNSIVKHVQHTMTAIDHIRNSYEASITMSASPLAVQSVVNNLGIVVNNLINIELRQITTSLIIGTDMIDDAFDNLVRTSTRYTTTKYCQLIKYIVVDTAAVQYFRSTILSNKYLKASFTKLNFTFPTKGLSNLNVNRSLKFALEFANHKQSTLMSFLYLLWSLDQLLSYCQLPFGRLNIISMYNKISPKVSLVPLLEVISTKVLKELFIEKSYKIPAALSKHLRLSALPPFAKEACLFDTYNNENPLEFDTIDPNGHRILITDLTKSLQLLSMFFESEFSIDIVENDINLSNKVLFIKITEFLDILVLSGFIASHESKPSKNIVFFYLRSCLTKLLQLPVKGDDATFIWNTFIDTAINFTIEDLQYLKTFQIFFDNVIEVFTGKPILKNPMVKSGIEQFASKFNCNIDQFPNLKEYTGIENSSNEMVTLSQTEIKLILEAMGDDDTGSIDTHSLDESIGKFSDLSLNKSDFSLDFTSGMQGGKKSQPASNTSSNSSYQSYSTPQYHTPPQMHSQLQSQHMTMSQGLPGRDYNQNNSGYSNNSRQQSIHVDKYKN